MIFNQLFHKWILLEEGNCPGIVASIVMWGLMNRTMTSSCDFSPLITSRTAEQSPNNVVVGKIFENGPSTTIINGWHGLIDALTW
jgi:hypothetical protein